MIYQDALLYTSLLLCGWMLVSLHGISCLNLNPTLNLPLLTLQLLLPTNSFVSHYSSPIVHNSVTINAILKITNCFKRGNFNFNFNKGPLCSPNSFNSDFENSSWLNWCWSWDMPQSFCTN